MFTLVLFLCSATGLLIFALRLAGAGKKRISEVIAALGLLLAVFGVNAWHVEDKKAGAEKLSGALVIMEDRLKAGDTTAALGILDRGIRLFAASQTQFDDAALQLWRYAVQTKTKSPNQALLPTTTAVTPAASHPSRQP